MNTNRNFYTLDIETVPSVDPAVHEILAASVSPPANITKAETLEKWEIEKKPALVHERISKTSFDGSYGSIAVIGVALNDEEPLAFYKDSTTPHEHEAEILKEFFAFLKDSYSPHCQRNPLWIGHNIVGFDLRFMFQRAVVLGVQPPAFIPFHAKPWDDCLHDNMIMYAGTRDTVSQDKLAKVLGLPGKEGIDGSDVWPLVAAGRIKEVADYCKHTDVVQAREIYKRITFQI